MAPPEKSCSTLVAEKLSSRRTAALLLRTMMKDMSKRLDLAVSAEQVLRPDVTASQEKLAYYLLQPKAKASPPPAALRPEEVILLQDDDGLYTARLTHHTSEYKESSYKWHYTVLRLTNLTLPVLPGAEQAGFLHPGDLWGVLRGEDALLDWRQLEVRLPAAAQVSYSFVTDCATCSAGRVMVFQEELAHLSEQLPFHCSHGTLVTSLLPSTDAKAPTLDTPRPGFPRMAAAGAPSVCSTINVPKLEARCIAIEEQQRALVVAHSDLVGEVEDSEEEIVGYSDLEQCSLDNYLDTWQDKVTTLILRAEGVVEAIKQLDDFEDEGGEVGGQVVGEVHQEQHLAVEQPGGGLPGQVAPLTPATSAPSTLTLLPSSLLPSTSSQPTITTTAVTSGATTVTYSSEFAASLGSALGSLQAPPAFTSAPLNLTSARPALASVRPALTSTQARPRPAVAASVRRITPPAQSSQPSTPQGRRSSAHFYSTITTPESKSHLRRKKKKLLDDLDEVDEWVAEHMRLGCTSVKAKLLDSALTALEHQLDEVMMLYGQHLRARGSPTTGGMTEERDRLYSECCKWLRVARRRNWDSVREEVVQQATLSHGAAHLQRIKLPSFDNKPENWADFRRRFKELIKSANYPTVVEMAQLRENLQEEAASYILGVTEPADAWAILEKKYGDRTLAILTTRHRLVTLQLPTGPAHDQVEALVQGLRHAKYCLKAVGAEYTLFGDITMVSTLLSKLPSRVQERWYHHRAALPPTTEPAEEGVLFEQWLHAEGEAANLARHGALGLELARATSPQPAVQEEEEVQEMPLRDMSAGGRLEAASFTISAALGTTPATTPSTNPTLTPSTRPTSREEARAIAATYAAELGPCPACQGAHTFPRTLGGFEVAYPSHRLSSCPAFNQLSPAQRATMLEEHAGCVMCSARDHKTRVCWQVRRGKVILCSARLPSGNLCGGRHHTLLHGSGSRYCEANTATSSTLPSSPALPATGSLFELAQVPVHSTSGHRSSSALVLTDTGSTDSFVTHHLAKELGLQGSPIRLFIKVVDGNFKEEATMVYQLALEDSAGARHVVDAIGMNSLTEVAPAPHVSSLASLFPKMPPQAAAAVSRPHGKVAVMLGMRDRQLHATACGLEAGSLRLCRSKFGAGWVLTGFHPIPPSSLPSSSPSSTRSAARSPAVLLSTSCTMARPSSATAPSITVPTSITQKGRRWRKARTLRST